MSNRVPHLAGRSFNIFKASATSGGNLPSSTSPPDAVHEPHLNTSSLFSEVPRITHALSVSGTLADPNVEAVCFSGTIGGEDGDGSAAFDEQISSFEQVLSSLSSSPRCMGISSSGQLHTSSSHSTPEGSCTHRPPVDSEHDSSTIDVSSQVASAPVIGRAEARSS